MKSTAAPLPQNPLPTDEPTKRPYVFPTPIFIPTFTSATDVPARITPPPRSPTSAPVATTLPPPGTPAPDARTATPADFAAIPAETETPAPEPEPDTADLARAAENALIAMGVVLFLGFMVISITAFLVYRRSKRAEKIAFIKQRLQGGK